MSVTFHETDIYSISLVSLAVGLQHLAALIKYILPKTYALTMLGLEVWFQLEAYYLITFAVTSIKVGVIMVLISHYVWFLHGGLMKWKERGWTRKAKETELPERAQNKRNLRFNRECMSMVLFRWFEADGGVIPDRTLRGVLGDVDDGNFWPKGHEADFQDTEGDIDCHKGQRVSFVAKRFTSLSDSSSAQSEIHASDTAENHPNFSVPGSLPKKAVGHPSDRTTSVPKLSVHDVSVPSSENAMNNGDDDWFENDPSKSGHRNQKRRNSGPYRYSMEMR